MPRASSIEDAALPVCREGSEGFDNGRQVLQVRGAASEWLPSGVGPLQSASAPAVGRNRRRPLKSRREGELLGAGDPVLSFLALPLPSSEGGEGALDGRDCEEDRDGIEGVPQEQGAEGADAGGSEEGDGRAQGQGGYGRGAERSRK